MTSDTRRIRVQGLDRIVTMSSPATILDALIGQGVDYPHGCTTGFCGLCKSRVISGRVDLLGHHESALSPAEREAGLTLPCCATPLTDCVIAPVQPDPLLPPVRSLDAEITDLRDLTHDIRRVRLHVPADARFDFLPGQYSSLSFGDLPHREFSMANSPHDPALEFFIRRVPQGTVTDFVFQHARVGDRVRVKGPYGLAYLREGHIGPLLAVAGGSGLAPIWSIVATALARGMRQQIRVYLGVRSERDVYLEEELTSLAQRYPNLAVEIAISEFTGSTTRRFGHVHEVVKADFDGQSLAGWRAYVAGPPVMVQAVSHALKGLRLADDHCHTDPFLTAAERHLHTGAPVSG